MRFNLPIIDLIEWVGRLLWRRKTHSHHLPYSLLHTWPAGLEGYLHLVEREVKAGEPRAIATFLFRRKRFNGYAKSALPTDIYIELKRSKLPGHTHTLIVLEADHVVKEGAFKALPLHYGEYVWLQPRAIKSTARRRVLVQRLPLINRWEERDRTAVLICFALAYELLASPHGVKWADVVAREERLLMSSDRPSEVHPPLKDGQVSGYLIDKEPRKWDS